MKKTLYFLCLLIVLPSLTWAQIEGLWKGELKVPNNQLDLFFDVKKTGDNYSALLSIPDQGAHDLPFDHVEYDAGSREIVLKMDLIGAVYKGQIDQDGAVQGTFSQSGYDFPMRLEKVQSMEGRASVKRNRPQEPQPPYSYKEEEVAFFNEKDNIKITGTLTIPEKADGSTPVVILFNGSGQQDRNSEVFGHKPFLVIADYLTNNGIAVLRCDDRGIGGTSVGENIKEVTTYDFARDGQAAIDFIKEKGYKNIHLLGHSEGGVIASILGPDNAGLKSLILFASNALKGDEILVEQVYLGGIAAGVDEEMARANKDMIRLVLDEMTANKDISNEALTDKVLDEIGKKAVFMDMDEDARKALVSKLVMSYSNSWIKGYIDITPSDYLTKVGYPVLAIFGGKDYQVPSALNEQPMKKALKNKDSKVVVFPNLNHLLQNAVTGAASEYAEIEETISPEVLETVLNWIRSLG